MSGLGNVLQVAEMLKDGKRQTAYNPADYIVISSFNVAGSKTNSGQANVREYVMKIEDFLKNTGGGGGVSDFIALADTPEKYEGQKFKYSRVNEDEDGLEFVDLLIPENTNTWDMADVAFVATNGNNLTAVVGDGNKPYASIANAMDAANIVIVLPGTYGTSAGTVQFTSARDKRHVICMEGVVFTGGGIYVYAGTTNVKFTGKAVMNGNFYNGLNVLTSDPVNIEFECKSMERCRTVCWLPNSNPQAKINFTADHISCTGVNGGAYAVRMYGTAEATFNIKNYAECSYAMFHCRSGFAGKLTVNCPESRTINPLNGNPYGNSSKNVLWLDSVLGAEIVFNGDLLDLYTTDRTGGVVNAANLLNGESEPTVTINGKIESVNTQCIYLWYRAARGVFIFNGDIINRRNLTGAQSVPIWTQLTGWGSTAEQVIVIKGNIQAFSRSVIGTGKKLYIYSPFIYNEDVPESGGLFYKSNTGGNQQSEIYIYNSKMELGTNAGTSEIILGDASLATDIVASVGTHGTESTLSSVSADAWAGYSQVAGLITPKI